MSTSLLVEPEYDALLRAHGLRDFSSFMALSAAGAPASTHWNRETVPVELMDGGRARVFFLKRLFRAQPEHVLGAVLRLRRPVAQPLCEWENIGRLRAAGVGVMRRVAAGQRTRWGWPVGAFLLVEAVPCAWSVADWMGMARLGEPASQRNPPCPPFARGGEVEAWMLRRLVVELGGLARRLDDAGIGWLDLDAKHVYARPHPQSRRGQRWEFWLIDVERLVDRPQSPHGVAAATAMADMLDPSASHPPVRTPGRWDLWVRLGARGTDSKRTCLDSSEEGIRGFLVDMARQQRRLARTSERDEIAASRPEPIVAIGGMEVRGGALALLQRSSMASFDGLFDHAAGERLDKAGLGSWRRRDRIELRDGEDRPQRYYLKRYARPPPLVQLRRVLSSGGGRSTAALERDAIEALEAAGVGASGWAAFGQRMRGGLEEKSLILLPEAGGESLERFVADCVARRRFPSPALRQTIIRLLADAVRRMHAQGLFHRDLYLAHVFIDASRERPELCLIDLARVIRRRGAAGDRWRIKDLAALDYSSPRPWITRADRLRFLCRYLGVAPGRVNRQANLPAIMLSPSVRTGSGARLRYAAGAVFGYAGLIARIARRTARMAKHDARHGRRGSLVQGGAAK